MALCLFSCLSACGCRDCTINKLAFYPPFAGYRFEEIATPKIRIKDVENNPAKQQVPSSARASQLQTKDTPRLSTITSFDNKFYKFILVYEEQELKSSRMHSEAHQNSQPDIPNQRQGNNEVDIQNLQKNGIEKDISRQKNQPPPPQVKSELKQIKVKPKKKGIAQQREEEFQQVEDLNLICFKRQNRIGTLICGYHVEYTRRRSDMVVIYSHGNSTDIGYMINQALDVAFNLRTNLIAFDYSGYGQSQGKPSERSCIYDLETIYLLARELGYSPINIVLYGQSVGSGPSTFMAAQKRFPIGGLIIHSGFASGLRITQDSLKAYSKKTSSKDFFPNVEFIRKVNAPILIIHGTDDMDIRMHHANELYAQAKRHYTPSILKVEGAGHNDIEHNDTHRKVYFMKLREFAQFLRKNRNALHDAYKLTKEGKSEPQDEANISYQQKEKANNQQQGNASIRNQQIFDEAYAWKRGFAGDGWSQSFNHIYKGYFPPSREQSFIQTDNDQEKNQKIIKDSRDFKGQRANGEAKDAKEKIDMNQNNVDPAVILPTSDKQLQQTKCVRQSVGDAKNNNAPTSKGLGILQEDNNKALKGSINDGGQVHVSSQVKGRENEEDEKRDAINDVQQQGEKDGEKQSDFITPQKTTQTGKKEQEEDNSEKDKKNRQADSIMMERVLDSSIRHHLHNRKDSSPIMRNENDRGNNNILSSMKQQQQQQQQQQGGVDSSLNAFNTQSNNNNNNNKGSSQIKMNSGLNDPRNISSLWLDQRVVEGQSYQFQNNYQQQQQQTTSEKPSSEVIAGDTSSQDYQQTSMAAFRGNNFHGEESKCEGDDDEEDNERDADDEGNDGMIRSHNVTSVIRKQHNSYFSAYILDNSQGGDFSESIYGSSLLHNTNARERASKTKIIQATGGGGGTTPQSQSKIGYRSSQTFFSTRKPSQQQQLSDSQNKQQYGKFSSYQHQPRIAGFADEDEEEEKEEYSGNVSKNSTKNQHGILDEHTGAANNNNNMGASRDHTSSGQKSSLLQVPLLQISEIASDHSNLRENEEEGQKSQIV